VTGQAGAFAVTRIYDGKVRTHRGGATISGLKAHAFVTSPAFRHLLRAFRDSPGALPCPLPDKRLHPPPGDEG
jgi:hypothetical protein